MKLIQIVNKDNASISTNAYLLESEKVKVFPCAYRGFKPVEILNEAGISSESKQIFDPEANGFTEYNFANIYGKQTKLISWSGNLLKCVIDGYYFEIRDIVPADLCIGNKLYKFAIVLEPINIVGSYQTKVLKSIKADNDKYLDTEIDKEYYFTGLALIDTDTYINGAVYFSPCKLDKKNNTAVIDWQAYRLTDTLDTGEGDGSARMLGTDKNGEPTVCKASGENAFAIGKNTKAGGNFSIAGGTESSTSFENSVAIGDHVNTSADNQVIFGAYNKENVNAALIIGGGSKSVQKNILEISKVGDINATGKLDVAGNISSSNGGLQLTNGFILVDHGYEYQKILDTATYDSNLTYYEKNTGTDEMTEKAVTAETFAGLKNNLYIKVHHLSSLDKNGNLLVDGNAQANKKLTVKEQAEISGNIAGHDNITINGAGKTHALTIGSQDGTGDYGSITVYGRTSTEAGQEEKTVVFNVNEEGAATIAKTLTVGNNKLVVNANGVSINNSKVTIENPTTINNTLAVKGATTITDTDITTTINKDSINYNNNFTVTNNGSITAKSLTLTDNYGINEQGKITGSELELKDGYKIAANGDATLKDLIINNVTLAGIKLEKGNYTVQDTDGTREINNSDALKITRYIENSDSGSEEAAQGLHVNGQITAAGDFAIGESSGATTKITQGGTAYFKQGLLVGGKVTGANEPDDTVTFRVAPFSPEAEQISYATLKGDLNIKKYNNKAGNLKVEGRADISGDLTVGTAGGGVKFTANASSTGIDITGITRITATQFNATSDLRKKTAIQDYICKKSILDLPIKEFEFIGDETHTKHIGCIAQDLQEICPEIVHKDADGYLSIEETKLVYLLLQEVKELKKELKILKGE